MPSAPPKPVRLCPNCNTPIGVGGRQCASCKMAVSQMAAFAAAKKAAEQRGFKKIEVEKVGPPIAPLIAKISFALLALGAVVFFGIKFYNWMNPPPRYLQFPATADASAQTFLTHIAGGNDADFDKAYALLADAARAGNDHGDFIQVFNVMNNYLTGEFDNWIQQTKFSPDPADPDTIIAKVSLETLHIHLAQQTPADKLKEQGPHYGVVSIDDFDVNDAKDFRQIAGIEGVVRGMAGQGAVNNIEAILGANAANRHQPMMVKKIGLLANIRNPHQVNWRTIIQTYPLRDDPVMCARLTSISTDPRYEAVIQEKAKEVLEDKVSEEEKIAVGL